MASWGYDASAMIARLIQLTLLACVFLMFSVSCTTEKGASENVENQTVEESLLSRPFLEKAIPRPLGRILLKWSTVDGATGYNLEMSTSEDFEMVEKNWTISGTSLELPIEEGNALWFRVRSFNSETSSRWSATQKVLAVS